MAVTQPSMFYNKGFIFNHQFLWVSGCGLVGSSPASFFVKQMTGISVVGLLEGHGSSGKAVLDFCAANLQNSFDREALAVKESPLDSLEKFLTTCDTELNRRTSGIDCSTSGAYVVMMVQTMSHLYFASIGDCKAVLGRLCKRTETSPEYIIALVLTDEPVRDSRESVEEVENVASTGAVSDFNYGSTQPRRSIGDSDLKNRTSEPILTTHAIDLATDQFVIIGSSDLWKSMDPQDAVDFVQANRRTALKNSELVAPSVPTPSNTSISHSLCAEARKPKSIRVDQYSPTLACVIFEFSATVSRQPRSA